MALHARSIEFTNLKGDTIKGFKQLIEELQWHIKTNNWSYPKEYYDNYQLGIFKF